MRSGLQPQARHGTCLPPHRVLTRDAPPAQSGVLSVLAVTNYRSLRQLLVPLGRLTIVTGANGVGKSSLYRALRLLASIAHGGAIGSLAREGGLSSTLWAGPRSFSNEQRRKLPSWGTRGDDPVQLRLGFAGAEPDDFGYAIDLGLPQPSASAFQLDPEIKAEFIWCGPVPRPAAMLVERKRESLRTCDAKGHWRLVERAIPTHASMLTEYLDPRGAPEMLSVREQLLGWRFYDHFRTDAQAPARGVRLGTFTPVLDEEGADLAAALQTIREIGDAPALDRALDDAFPGSRLNIVADERSGLEVLMSQPGLQRALTAAELSDGTLRYLLWMAAVLSPRPPALLVLNEPETSLHADLLPALGRLIVEASRRSQVVVVSHARRLIEAMEDCRVESVGRLPGRQSIVLEKVEGATCIANLELDLETAPPWRWPAR